MRYADTLLADGERIALRTRQHWLAPLLDARYAVLLLVASAVVWVFGVGLSSEGALGGLRTIIGWASIAGLLAGVAWLGRVYWNWYAQDYIITNRRVLKVEGIVNKRSADSSLEKINDAVLEQSLLGRLLGFGNLDILTAAEVAIDRYQMLNDAPAFKREMLNQKQALEMELVRGVTPPLRAAAPGNSAGSMRPMSPEEITQTLARLADLRDQGAISADDYEAKKSELLARL